jgi:exopolysaccharide biosynthesis polyprenyl glycosylphosphotransferase
MSDAPSSPVASRRQRVRSQTLLLVLSDAVAVLLGGVIATLLRFGTLQVTVRLEGSDLVVTFPQLVMWSLPLWVAFLWVEGLYGQRGAAQTPGYLGRIARATVFGGIALVLVTYALKLPGLSRGWLVTYVAVAFVAVVISRAIVDLTVTSMHLRGRWLRPTLVVGSNPEGADIIRILRANPASGLVPIGCLASSIAEKLDLQFCEADVPCFGAAREIVAVLAEHPVDTVIIASSAFDHEVLARIVAELRTLDVEVNVSSGLFEVMTSRVLVSEVAGVPLVTIRGISLTPSRMALKRAFDLLVSGLVLLVGLPIWAICALLVKATSPGPLFYSQERIGRDGRAFRMVKFRTMYVDAEARLEALQARNEASGPIFKMRNDPRVTPAGKWLRKFSIDEVPQFINVLTGVMSVVGPRPPLPHETREYEDRHWRRLEVTPGMTGLWQVSGRSSLTFEEMVRLDLFYIENWSVGLDLAIILRTIPAVLFARGAY